MKEVINIEPPEDQDELMLYEMTSEQKIKILAAHILWSSLVFLVAMIA